MLENVSISKPFNITVTVQLLLIYKKYMSTLKKNFFNKELLCLSCILLLSCICLFSNLFYRYTPYLVVINAVMSEIVVLYCIVLYCIVLYCIVLYHENP